MNFLRCICMEKRASKLKVLLTSSGAPWATGTKKTLVSVIAKPQRNREKICWFIGHQRLQISQHVSPSSVSLAVQSSAKRICSMLQKLSISISALPRLLTLSSVVQNLLATSRGFLMCQGRPTYEDEEI